MIESWELNSVSHFSFKYFPRNCAGSVTWSNSSHGIGIGAHEYIVKVNMFNSLCANQMEICQRVVINCLPILRWFVTGITIHNVNDHWPWVGPLSWLPKKIDSIWALRFVWNILVINCIDMQNQHQNIWRKVVYCLIIFWNIFKTDLNCSKISLKELNGMG